MNGMEILNTTEYTSGMGDAFSRVFFQGVELKTWGERLSGYQYNDPWEEEPSQEDIDTLDKAEDGSVLVIENVFYGEIETLHYVKRGRGWLPIDSI